MSGHLPPINIPDAKIIFKNFAGRKTRYKPEGTRTFCLVVSPDDGKRMEAEGWNIKWGKPREDGSILNPFTEIMVQYNSRVPPMVYQKSGPDGVPVLLTAKTVAGLDTAEIIRVDLVINPSEWDVNGATGIKGYLKSAYVTIAPPDPFEAEYLAEYADGQNPFSTED